MANIYYSYFVIPLTLVYHMYEWKGTNNSYHITNLTQVLLEIRLF